MRGAVATSWGAFQREGTDRTLVRSPPALTAATLLLVLAALAIAGMRMAGVEPLTVLSGSMSPSIDRGDLVLVGRAQAHQARVGQVITFRSPDGRDRTVTHRVLAVRAQPGALAFTTKGDANPAAERWSIPHTGRIGVVRATMPYAGYLVHPFSAGWGRAVMLLVLTLAAAGTALWLIWRPSP